MDSICLTHPMSNSDNELNYHLVKNYYLSPHERQAHLDSKYSGRFKVHSNNNHDNYAAVHDTYTGNTYHLHRGTANWEDVGTDAGLAVGNLHNTSRYRTTEERIRQAKQSSPGGEHVHIGHSLGGTLADTFARQQGDKSVAYNMGSSPFATKHEATDQNRHIRVGSDFVSSFQNKTGSETVEKKKDKFDVLVDAAKNTINKTGALSQFGSLGSVNMGLGVAHSAWNALQSHYLTNFHP
jgi:hypothetical protein